VFRTGFPLRHNPLSELVRRPYPAVIPGGVCSCAFAQPHDADPGHFN
jgi:hypothetical protein